MCKPANITPCFTLVVQELVGIYAHGIPERKGYPRLGHLLNSLLLTFHNQGSVKAQYTRVKN